MNKIIPVSILFSFMALAGYPKEVPQEKAREVARKVYFERINSTQPISLGEIYVTEINLKTDHGIPLYYIFNMAPDGWVAIAADDAVHPILAYSFEGRYDEANQAPQFTAWMKQYEDQIRYAIQENVPAFTSTNNTWQHLLDPASGI